MTGSPWDPTPPPTRYPLNIYIPIEIPAMKVPRMKPRLEWPDQASPSPVRLRKCEGLCRGPASRRCRCFRRDLSLLIAPERACRGDFGLNRPLSPEEAARYPPTQGRDDQETSTYVPAPESPGIVLRHHGKKQARSGSRRADADRFGGCRRTTLTAQDSPPRLLGS